MAKGGRGMCRLVNMGIVGFIIILQLDSFMVFEELVERKLGLLL